MSAYTETWTISHHSKPVTFVSFSQSGELLATGDDDGYVYLWSVASKELFQSLPKCSKEAVSCCWGDDKEIFVGSGNGELHFFEHRSSHNRFERNSRFFVDQNHVHIASLAVCGNRLVCCTGNSIHCYNFGDSELSHLFSWSMAGVWEIRTVHFLDRKTVLAATIREGECILLDVAEPEHHLWRRKLRHKVGESALAWDGKLLAVTTLASSVCVYEICATGLRLLHEFAAPNRLSSNFPLQNVSWSNSRPSNERRPQQQQYGQRSYSQQQQPTQQQQQQHPAWREQNAQGERPTPVTAAAAQKTAYNPHPSQDRYRDNSQGRTTRSYAAQHITEDNEQEEYNTPEYLDSYDDEYEPSEFAYDDDGGYFADSNTCNAESNFCNVESYATEVETQRLYRLYRLDRQAVYCYDLEAPGLYFHVTRYL
ncbi:WD40 repeat-like protein [Auricularia subglabra TFB-10046 SS5]|nr:WD40 repeat-like protein [Auricularia subglabra TFB-10046 SS5]